MADALDQALSQIPGLFGGSSGPDSDIAACAGSGEPCTAAWQKVYTYYADKQWEMAKVQALLGLLYGYVQYKSADRTADRQYDIANRQMVIAEEEYARYKCVYVECEDRYATEICAMQLPDTEYEFYADRLERNVRKKFSYARNKIMRHRSRYCVADTLNTLCKMEKAETLSVVAARDTGYRFAEARRDVLEERRHSRKMDMVKMGRDIKTDQSTDYSGAMGSASAALGNGLAAKKSLYDTVFGVGQGLLGSYYATQISPFPYGTGYTGASTTTVASSQSGVAPFASGVAPVP